VTRCGSLMSRCPLGVTQGKIRVKDNKHSHFFPRVIESPVSDYTVIVTKIKVKVSERVIL